MIAIEQQASEIAEAVHVGKAEEDIGAGDQGLMFGYATDETEECMPLTVMLAHQLNSELAKLRKNGTLPWLRPDSKTQVSRWFKKIDFYLRLLDIDLLISCLLFI